MSDGVAIVGASHAGVQVAAALREYGYDGPVCLIHGETALPYQKPPLSKSYLAGAATADSLALRSTDFYAAKGIELIPGAWVESVEPDARCLHLRPVADDGPARGVPETLAYDSLVLATGASARPLPVPGGEGDGVFTLRNLAESDALAARLAAARDLVVVGAGFIGLEVAATARKLGKAVTVVEVEERVLARLCPPVLADFLAQRHRAAGTEFLFGTRVAAIEAAADGRRSVRLDDGRVLTADLVVVGIGAAVNDGLARAIGLDAPDGVPVDSGCGTAAPGVFAVGDCAAWPTPFAERPQRTESVQTAVDQAKTAAAAIAGAPLPAQVAPWFWSDQLDLKVQIVGTDLAADEVVCRGDMDAGKFSLLHYRGEVLTRVDSVNSPADHLAARRLVTARARPPKAAAADPDIRLKELGAAAA